MLQGDYAKAEKLQREALRINKKALGDEHPIVAAELNNLAVLLWNQVGTGTQISDVLLGE